MRFTLLKSMTGRTDDDEFVEDSPEQIAAAMALDYSRDPIPYAPEEPLYGLLAQALAFSAPMANMQGVPWNSVVDTGEMSEEDCRYALDSWGITSEDRWLEVVDELLNGVYGNAVVYWAVRARARAARRFGSPIVADDAWAAEISAIFTEREQLESISTVQAEMVTVHRIENSMRRSRLLGADEQIEGYDAYDLGRAFAVARWGVRTGWGTEHLLPNLAFAAAATATETYTSWRQYGLGYLAGRIATYPDSYGSQHVLGIKTVRPLLDSAASPWANLPFPDHASFRRVDE